MGALVSAYASQVREPAVLSDLVSARMVREVVCVVAGAGLVGIAAQLVVPVPGTPVPVTGQTFAVLLCGASLGARRGALSLALYLVAGVAGVGWFADGSSGLGAPSLGYVVGFLPAAALVGYLAARGWDRTPARTVAVMAAGTLVIYSVGVPWLAVALDVSLLEALRLGLWPFLLGDVLKVAVAAGVFPLAWLAMRRFDRE
jgi:biotin transport system substrate-specific component